jgi:succinate dehydrogenase / fumarate reductase flavoprotein subunit
MRIYPAIHYTMGGLWVDYNLMSNVPGLHVLGEANFSDPRRQPPRRERADAGLADGYFVIPYTLANYLGGHAFPPVTTDDDAFKEAEARRCRRASTRCSQARASETPRPACTAGSGSSSGITSAWPRNEQG